MSLYCCSFKIRMIDPKIIEMSGKANKEMICFKPKAVRIFEGTNMLFRFFFFSFSVFMLLCMEKKVKVRTNRSSRWLA